MGVGPDSPHCSRTAQDYIHLKFQSNNIISWKNVHSKCASFTEICYCLISGPVEGCSAFTWSGNQVAYIFVWSSRRAGEVVTNLRLQRWHCGCVYCLCGCVFTSQEKDLVFSLASFNLSPSQKHNFPKQIFHFDSCFRRYSLNRMCSVTSCCFIILAVTDPPVCC